MATTAIYVFQPSTVRIWVSDARDQSVALCRFGQQGINVQPGTRMKLEPGIYTVSSRAEIKVELTHLEVVAIPQGKDKWPDPKPNVLELEGATAEEVRHFVGLARDASPG